MRAPRRALIALALLAACGGARADIAAGKWRVSTRVVLPGLPGALGPFEQSECLSAGQAKDPGRLFGAPGGAGGCAFARQRDDGSRFTFELTCGGATQMSGSGDVRYAGDSLDGELTLRGGVGGQTIETRVLLSAHRLGPCTR